MKRFVLVTALVVLGMAQAFAQYPLRTIRAIQERPLDSLRVLDTLQRTNLSRWTLQRSPFYPETVKVRGVCVVPAKVINFTANGFNMLLADTANKTSWGGLFVRPADLAALGIGLVVSLLPLGRIVGMLVDVGFSLVRPILLGAGICKISEWCRPRPVADCKPE